MFDRMRIFVKVAESGSFSSAAKQLHMAPSSISRNIDSLEAELGVTLFVRSTRNLTLTEKGKDFLNGTRDILDTAQELILATKSEASEPEGTLRVSTFESFGRIHVSEWIASFVQLHPSIKIDFELDNNVVDLITSEIDLAIRIGQPADSNLRARRLASNRTILCAAPSYLAENAAPKTPKDIVHHNCLALSHKRQQTHWHFRRGIEREKVMVTGNIRSSGGTPLLIAALKGRGITLLSHWMIAEHINSGELVPLLTDWFPSLYPESDGEIFAVYPNQKYMKPLLRAFIDHLSSMAEQENFNADL